MSRFSILATFLFSLTVCAAEPAPSSTIPSKHFIEGKDYFVLAEPVITADTTKIEVMEAFAYTCHACFNFDAMLESWTKKQLADVNFVRTHVAFRSEWVPYQRGYYTLLSLHLKEDVSKNIFNAIHREHKELNTAQDWAEFLAAYGADKQTVIKMYNSFGVNSLMKQANARAKSYRLEAAPTLIIEGRYKVSNNLKTYDDTLKVAQFLIDKVRAEKSHR